MLQLETITMHSEKAGYSISTGSQNVLMGGSAGRSITTASYNTYIGESAGRLTTPEHGTQVLASISICNTTGQINTALGYLSSYIT